MSAARLRGRAIARACGAPTAAVLVAWAQAAGAQGSAAASVSVPQLEPAQPAARAASVGTEQLSGASAAMSGRRARAELVNTPGQIAPAAPTAEAAPALSTRAEGRAVAVAPVAGHDRCEPAAGAPPPAGCAARIEARAGEYARPGAAPITAEGRLLVLTDEGGSMATPAGAARQLGTVGAELDAATAGAAGAVAAALSQPDVARPPDGAGAPATPPVVVLSPH